MTLRDELQTENEEQKMTPENYFQQVATYNPSFFQTASVISELNRRLTHNPESNHTELFTCARADARRAYAMLSTPSLLEALLTSDKNKAQRVLTTLAKDHLPVAIYILTTPSLKEKLTNGERSLKDTLDQIANAHSKDSLVKTLCVVPSEVINSNRLGC